MDSTRVSPIIEYRADPRSLSTSSILAELLNYIAEAERWPGPLGAYARARAAALRAELRQRYARAEARQ